jgi:hypothetical protein
MIILNSKTVKGMIQGIDKNIGYNKFSKMIDKEKSLYELEKMILKLFFYFKPSWDIEVSFMLLCYSYDFDKEDLFGILRAINPGKGSIVKDSDLIRFMYRGDKKFKRAKPKEVSYLFRR